MIETIESAPAAAPAPSESTQLSNPAVARCANAWQRTFKLASIDPKNHTLEAPYSSNDHFPREQAAIKYREAMPSLSGLENIRDFIACVAYAMLKDYMTFPECTALLAAAKVALAAIRAESRYAKPDAEQKK